MKDPYRILGVAPQADLEAIRAAYRTKVKQTHPDAGGTSQAFNEVLAAYEILSDQERRKRYDETGEFGISQATSTGAEAIIDNLLNIIVQKADALDVNVLQMMQKEIAAALLARNANIDRLRQNEQKIKELRRRFRKTAQDERDILGALLDRRSKAVEKALEHEELNIAQLKYALAILTSYEFSPSANCAGEQIDLSAFGPPHDPLIKTNGLHKSDTND